MTKIIETIALMSLFLLGIASCASLPTEFDKTPSYSKVSTPQNSSRLFYTQLSKQMGKSGFYALADGKEALAVRLKLIEQASTSLDAQYYIWHDDLAGKAMYYALMQAAERGVRVRILLDDLDTQSKQTLLAYVNEHPNIDIRLFNPFANRNWRAGDAITDFRRVNRRMHNKSLTADGLATVFGGRNIGDEYFDASQAVAFNDVDVLAVGPVVADVSTAFDRYWNSDWAFPLQVFDSEPLTPEAREAFIETAKAEITAINETAYADVVRNMETITAFDINNSFEFEWSDWVLGYDDPSKIVASDISKRTHLAPNLKQALDAAQKEINIVSAYFVPGKDFTTYLTERVKEGVKVRILTNSLSSNDVSIVHAGYMRYRKNLVAGGVELYEFKADKKQPRSKKKNKPTYIGSSNASLHSKYMTFDQSHVFVGSFNLDARSVALNTEMGVYFGSKRYAKKISHLFETQALEKAYRLELTDGELEWVTMEKGEEKRFNKEPEIGFWKRVSVKFMSFFVPESQL